MTGVVHIVIAMKPVESGFAENAVLHGVVGLNIDGCRVKTSDSLNGGAYAKNGSERHDGTENWRYKREGGAGEFEQPSGRWPANVILDDSDEVMLAFPETTSGGGIKNPIGGALTWKKSSNWKDSGYQEASTGSSARFFKQVAEVQVDE